jgi:hypothetical protein
MNVKKQKVSHQVVKEKMFEVFDSLVEGILTSAKVKKMKQSAWRNIKYRLRLDMN